MKTKRDLERLAASVGATLEEDDGYRGMRVYQLVAPAGLLWRSSDGLHLRVEWATGGAQSAVEYNEREYVIAAERVACGLEPIPADRLEEFSND